MTRKKLTIGIQTFREIREEGHYYVDKTAFAWHLVDSSEYHFRSRQLRFGNWLFPHTLAEPFTGRVRTADRHHSLGPV